jgi:hypothetical protein
LSLPSIRAAVSIACSTTGIWLLIRSANCIPPGLVARLSYSRQPCFSKCVNSR